MAETDPVHLMMAKRTTNRQLELMGFKTGMQWSMDTHMASAVGGYGMSEQSAGIFEEISQEDGLRAAIDWRDKRLGLEYQTD